MRKPTGTGPEFDQLAPQFVIELPVPPGVSDELQNLIAAAQTGIRLVVEHLREAQELALTELESLELKFLASHARRQAELEANQIVDTCIELLHKIRSSASSLESQLRAAGSDRLTLDDETPLMDAANAIIKDMQAIIANYLLRWALP